jgi:hypothetical protein
MPHLLQISRLMLAQATEHLTHHSEAATSQQLAVSFPSLVMIMWLYMACFQIWEAQGLVMLCSAVALNSS